MFSINKIKSLELEIKSLNDKLDLSNQLHAATTFADTETILEGFSFMGLTPSIKPTLISKLEQLSGSFCRVAIGRTPEEKAEYLRSKWLKTIEDIQLDIQDELSVLEGKLSDLRNSSTKPVDSIKNVAYKTAKGVLATGHFVADSVADMCIHLEMKLDKELDSDKVAMDRITASFEARQAIVFKAKSLIKRTLNK